MAIRTAAAGNNATALGTAAVTKLNNAVDRLIATQIADGSWGGDAYATALALQSLPGVVLPDTDGDGVPNESETFLGTNPTVADTKYLAGSSSHAVVSINDAEQIASVNLGSGLSHQLATQGGTPVAYGLTTGQLPMGLSLDSASGLISGLASTTGTFNFIYGVTHADGSVETRAAAIVIGEAVRQVPAVPTWGLTLLAGCLALFGLSAQRRKGAQQC